MIKLSNNHLLVELIDPQKDLELLGTRYTGGGSIFQIYDLSSKLIGHTSHDNTLPPPLLSGPTYPDAYNTYDGQGIPDSFSARPLLWEVNRDTQLILGVGVCDLEGRLVTKCDWTICEESAGVFTFTTQHKYFDGELLLSRKVVLHHRTIVSSTAIQNLSSYHASVAWYPHPFFPQAKEGKLLRMNIPLPSQTLLTTPWYFLEKDGWLYRRQEYPAAGAYWALDHFSTSPLWLMLAHDQIGKICFESDYVPGFFPIWGNSRTISFEPYMERQVPRRGCHTWSVTYHF